MIVMNRIELEAELSRVGKESLRCERRCEGVKNSPDDGLSPWPTMVSSTGAKAGCVIVSLTPLRTAPRKQKLLAATKDSGDLLKHRQERLESSAFYSKLDAFRNELGLKGATVWTTLCKCERIKGRELPSETIQACIGSHLAKELEHIDKSVPLIAVGNRAFNTVRQNFPNRFVLNVPSPDGVRGDFQKTIENTKLLNLAKARIKKNQPGALCLCPPCARELGY